MLLNNGKYRYSRSHVPGVYWVYYRETARQNAWYVGNVWRSATERDRWLYMAVGQHSPTGGFATRRLAADHLVSASRPSAAWLS